VSQLRERLLAQTDDPQLRAALDELERKSHFAPVTDIYGYNRGRATIEPAVVGDLMLSAQVEIQAGGGELILSMTDGRHWFHCVFDVAAREIRLLIDGKATALRRGIMPSTMQEGSVIVEMSTFDRQLLLAVDGQLVFEPWPQPALQDDVPHSQDAAPSNAPNEQVLREPVRFGARGLHVAVNSLKLFRDVYYRKGRGVNGVDEACELGPDDYFVVGDNSPISLDSRGWSEPAVNKRMLIGKPFLVHLPSRQGKIEIGGRVAYFRIPDNADDQG